MTVPLTAAEASALLGISRATLYAYVSRGLIRSEPGGGRSRERLYSAADVQTLTRRQEERRDPERAAQGTLDWGTPLLDSELTLIRGGRLFYRGQDAVRLSGHARLEDVAGLLWTGELQALRMPLKSQLSHLPMLPGTSLLEALGHALTLAGARDLQAQDTRPEARPRNAARVLALGFAVAERVARIPAAPDLPLHERLGRAWAAGRPAETDLLRRALVLIADHELNISAFTVRCVVSGGASLHHAALAGLCALQGVRHGLGVQRATELLAATERGGPAPALAGVLGQGGLPGFGHRLYPGGDPRAQALLGHLRVTFPGAPAVQAAERLAQTVLQELGEHPNVDLALATTVRVLGGTPEQGVALFALGRLVGWLAHGLEELNRDRLIRPRARYVGLPPEED